MLPQHWRAGDLNPLMQQVSEIKSPIQTQCLRGIVMNLEK